MLRTGPRTVGALTTAMNVTQPTVSQHLRVLGEAMLVKVERKGNQCIHHLDSRGLAALRQYVDTFWDRGLDSYQQKADQIAAEGGDGRRKANE